MRVRSELNEAEPAPNRDVKKADAPIGGIHRSQDMEIGWYPEGFLRVRQLSLDADVPFVCLQERYEFAKDPCYIAPIELVDEKQKLPVRLLPGRFARLNKDAVAKFKAPVTIGTVPLNEVLVPERRMERHLPYAVLAPVGLPPRGQFERRTCLAGAGWPIQHDVLPLQQKSGNRIINR
jgi:hypothetical protein